MYRQDADYNTVAKVADALKAKGIEPSLIDICKAMGNVKPTSSILYLLEEWYHNQPEFKRTKNTPLSENIQLSTHAEKNEAELEKSLSLLRATLESTADGIMMVNGKGKIVDWNQKFVEMWRIPTELMEAGPENLSFDYILGQLADPSKIISDVEFLYSNPEWQGELKELDFKDGRVFERFTQPQRIGEDIVGRVYSFRDVTRKRMDEEELKIRQHAIEASAHGVVILDITKEGNPIVYVNTAFERITGSASNEILGRQLSDFYRAQDDEANPKRIQLAIREKNEETVELEVIQKNGESLWCEISIAPVQDSNEQVRHYVCLFNDVTERREMEQQLLKQATHDSLSGLPNRVLLMDRVEQAIIQAKSKKSMLGFIFLDLDQFKMTNDTLGHSIGDQLLQAVANRLIMATGAFDTVARFGGDEFVIVLPDINSSQEAEDKALNILESLDKTFRVGPHKINITASLGISFFPRDGSDYESLMKNADLSMYHAKDSGRNTYRVFESEMNSRVVNRVRLGNALSYALEKQEFFVVYQPLIDLKTGDVTGVEALLRWDSKEVGMVSPLDFIPIAEETGEIIAIGEWVLEQACNQVANWHKQGLPYVSVAVNISGRQLYSESLPKTIEEVLCKSKLPPQYLELELTESLLIDNVDRAVEAMHQFKSIGVKLAIDDFGTGYSSLSYLKRFPIDKLKIDRSFIRDLVSDSNDSAIVKAIINLGHSLNLTVLAEGVENEYQLEFIVEHGCDMAQGYFYSPPNRSEIIIEYLSRFSKS